MVGVSKTFTNQKKVLNNIYLSFFYGAKIGIIGLNGSGKSTLMKIIAGLDKNFQGEVVFSPGYTVGYLEQEPQLDDSKTVREVVEEGCADDRGAAQRVRAGQRSNSCEPMDDDTMAQLDRTAGRVVPSRSTMRAAGSWTTCWNVRWTPCVVPIADQSVKRAVGRRTPSRGVVSVAVAAARRTAAGRADQPPRRRVASTGWNSTCNSTRVR